eukprot:15445087-Alexandrium_andersonii.AAC.1
MIGKAHINHLHSVCCQRNHGAPPSQPSLGLRDKRAKSLAPVSHMSLLHWARGVDASCPPAQDARPEPTARQAAESPTDEEFDDLRPRPRHFVEDEPRSFMRASQLSYLEQAEREEMQLEDECSLRMRAWPDVRRSRRRLQEEQSIEGATAVQNETSIESTQAFLEQLDIEDAVEEFMKEADMEVEEEGDAGEEEGDAGEEDGEEEDARAMKLATDPDGEEDEEE